MIGARIHLDQQMDSWVATISVYQQRDGGHREWLGSRSVRLMLVDFEFDSDALTAVESALRRTIEALFPQEPSQAMKSQDRPARMDGGGRAAAGVAGRAKRGP